MPNAITSTGLTIATIDEIISTIENGSVSFPGYLTIFPGANVQPNSPDANLINIFAQVAVDMGEFMQMIYDSFDPDQAIGVTLDSRCAINGVIRNAGTYTQQPIAVTSTGTPTLQGLDLYPANPFTVSDPQGNQYQLLATYTFAGAGTVTLNFQAASIGAVQSTVDTITSIVTVTAGITAVNNPSGPTEVGVAEETDAQLRIRRSNSVAIGSTGYTAGLLGALLALPGVTGAVVLENDGSSPDSNSIPGHSIWVIVAGGTSSAILQTVYDKKAAGCGQMNSGSFAVGTPVMTPTTVQAAVVTAGGSGYTSAPTVTVTGGGGSAATATATVSGGQVTGVTINNHGTGYTSTPSLVFSGGGGSGAAATAELAPTSVASITVTNAGSFYFNAPTVEITGGGGTGATAIAFVNAAGQITGYDVTAGGSGYYGVPEVILNPNTQQASIEQLAGPDIIVYYDTPISENLYFKATVDAITGNDVDFTWLAAQLALTTYSIGEKADASSLTALIKQLAPNCYVSNAQVSTDNATWENIVSTTGVNYQFALLASNITLTS